MRLTARSWPGVRPRIGVAITCLSAAFVAACASPVLAPGGSRQSGDPGARPEPLDRVHQQANDALARWAQAVRESGGASITFTGEMTSQIGSWEEAVGDNNKGALIAGEVEAATALPDDRPGRREVRWVDGATIDVNVLSARDALADLVAAGVGDCGGCEPLRVTDADLATGLIETSRGPAEVPVWVYSVRGSAVRVTRVAVDGSVTVVPPPWNADDPPVGLSILFAVGTEDSLRLEVHFVGAVEDDDEPCGAGYTAEAVESELAVVVIVLEHRNPTPGACTLAGRTRKADVDLESELGDRVVLEVQQGLPVPVQAP